MKQENKQIWWPKIKTPWMQYIFLHRQQIMNFQIFSLISVVKFMLYFCLSDSLKNLLASQKSTLWLYTPPTYHKGFVMKQKKIWGENYYSYSHGNLIRGFIINYCFYLELTWALMEEMRKFPLMRKSIKLKIHVIYLINRHMIEGFR